MPITTFLDLAQLPGRTQEQHVFDNLMAALLQNLPTWGGEVNATLAAMNAALAAVNSLAAGGVYAIPYKVSTTTTDADPGAGFLRFDSATQNAATTLRLDLVGSDTRDYAAMLDTLDASTSTVKGSIRICRQGDPSAFLVFDVVARSAAAGYRNISVTPRQSSSSNPFVDNEPVLLFFQRNGDVGAPGTQLRRTVAIASSTTPTPDAGSTDLFSISALAANATFGAPTGTTLDGQALMIRIKDNGTARTLAWNTAYRAGADNALPGTTTANKTMYVGFTYNLAALKWDLVAVLDNI